MANKKSHSQVPYKQLPIGLCMAAMVLPAWSQDPVSATPDVERGERRIEEIIVSAQHREQSLQDVPMAITALSRDFIENNEITNIDDLTRLVPSLQLTPSGTPGGGDIRIRGVGSDVFSAAVEPNVLVMLDGVPLARSNQAAFDFADIERIEVLRGPQGTLFGKNSSAGIIHVITRDPTEEFEARVRTSYEQPDSFPGSLSTTQFTASGGLVPGLSARVSGFYKENEGIYKDLRQHTDAPDWEQWGLRSKVNWQPTEALRTQLNLEYLRTNGEPTPVAVRSANPLLAERLGPDLVGERNRNVMTPGGGIADRKGRAASLQIDWDLGKVMLTSITGYRDFDSDTNNVDSAMDGLLVDLLENRSIGEVTTFTQELRITSQHSDVLEYTAGVLWFDNRVDSDLNRIITSLPVAPGLAIDLNEGSSVRADTRNLGIYAQGTWHVDDRWSLTAGARYIDEKVKAQVFERFSNQYLAGTNIPIGGDSYSSPSRTVSDTAFTGRFSVQYDWADHSVVYGAVSSGYRGSAYDLAASLSLVEQAMENPIDPEKSTNYELGIKSRLLDDRLELNVAAFWTEFRDFQAQVRSFSTDDTVVGFRTDNAGKLITRGVELDFRAQITDAFSVMGSALFNRAFYDEFITQCFFGQQMGEGGAIDLDGDGLCDVQDVSGGRLANAPKRSMSITGRYDHQFARSGHVLYGQLTGRWQDEVQFTNEQHPLTKQGSYSIWDARVGWLSEDGRWEVAGYIKNLFGKHYVASIVPNSLMNDRRDLNHNIRMDADRVFGLTLAYNWF